VELEVYVVMPNHLHVVILLVDADLHAGPDQHGAHIGAPPRGRRSEPTSLPRLIQCFKTMTTHETMGGVKASGWPRFQRRLWQRSYYDPILRTERELIAIRR